MKKLSVVMGNVVSVLALKSAVVSSNLACGLYLFSARDAKRSKEIKKILMLCLKN